MHAKSKGFTVVELMIVVAVVGIIMVLALPSYRDIQNKRAVTNAAEQVSSFMNVARSESVKRNRQLSVTFDNTAMPFCIGISDTTAFCDCRDTTAADYCEITQGGVTTNNVLVGDRFENILAPEVTAEGADDTVLLLTFDPVRGVLDTANDDAGTMLFTSENGEFAVRVDVTLSGRIEMCTPASEATPGFETC